MGTWVYVLELYFLLPSTLQSLKEDQSNFTVLLPLLNTLLIGMLHYIGGRDGRERNPS